MAAKKNERYPLRIQGYGSAGEGVARLEGRVVFVPRTIAGERWRVRLEKVNKKVAWGRGVELLAASPERLESDCPLFGKCGGCQFRHMTYAEELRAKGQRVADALEVMLTAWFSSQLQKQAAEQMQQLGI